MQQCPYSYVRQDIYATVFYCPIAHSLGDHFLGHGTGVPASDVFVFDDDGDMKTKGLTLYCSDPEHLRPAEDSSELSKQTRAAGIALAAHCSVAAAFNFMKKKTRKYFRGQWATAHAQKCAN